MSQRSIGNRFYMWTQPNFVLETDAQADDSEAAEQKVRRAERGTLPKLSTFLAQLKGGPSCEKQFFEKSLTMPKN